MPDLFAYLEGFGTGESFTKSIIIVTDLPTGSTVTATKGETVKTTTEKDGKWWFKNLDLGEWTLKATLDDQSATTTFNIERFGVYYVSMAYRFTPEFTYTGDYEVVDDDNRPIEDFAGWKNNWKIRFLTSGTLTITNMYGWKNNVVDMFIVGPGGGGKWGVNYVESGQKSGGEGGAGGFSKTVKNITLSLNTPYEIVIGSPGKGSSLNNNPTSGGTTTAFNNDVQGGSGAGKTDRSAYEFDGESGNVYGKGGPFANPVPGGDNTGNGGGGGRQQAGGSSGADGGSGIVIIRNAREAA